MWDIDPQLTQRHERSQPKKSRPQYQTAVTRSAGSDELQVCGEVKQSIYYRPHARLSRQKVWVFPQKQGDIIPIALPMCVQHSRFLCSEAGACMGFVV